MMTEGKGGISMLRNFNQRSDQRWFQISVQRETVGNKMQKKAGRIMEISLSKHVAQRLTWTHQQLRQKQEEQVVKI